MLHQRTKVGPGPEPRTRKSRQVDQPKCHTHFQMSRSAPMQSRETRLGTSVRACKPRSVLLSNRTKVRLQRVHKPAVCRCQVVHHVSVHQGSKSGGLEAHKPTAGWWVVGGG